MSGLRIIKYLKCYHGENAPAFIFRWYGFALEARGVAARNHPTIVALFDVGDGYVVVSHSRRKFTRNSRPRGVARQRSKLGSTSNNV